MWIPVKGLLGDILGGLPECVADPPPFPFSDLHFNGALPSLVPEVGVGNDVWPSDVDDVSEASVDIPTTSKNPILLPSKNDFVSLVIKDVHVKVKHNGVRDTLTTLRDYWVLRGREATKRIVTECVICRKFKRVPFKPQSSLDLPDKCVAETPPFIYTGVDFAGPLYITSPRHPQSNESISEEVYICLFTCASTRAFHLELTRDLAVNSFLQAFCRFSSRRRLPSTLIADNAKPFKASSKEIEKLVKSPEVQHYFSNSRVTWKFIIEKAL